MDTYIGEIRMFAGMFAPAGWNFCDGTLINIADNSALFQLIGTTCGGDGVNNFALPNLQGRVLVGQGTGSNLSPRAVGGSAGTETQTLTTPQLPVHNHPAAVTDGTASTKTPGNSVVYGNVIGNGDTYSLYTTLNQPDVKPHMMNINAVGATGADSRTTTRCRRCPSPSLSLSTDPTRLRTETRRTMSEAFLAEIRIFGFDFPPARWAFCNGQSMGIAQNTALYSLLGTNFGGNGTTNFNLPNLQGSAACATGQGSGLSNRFIGAAFGTPSVTLQTTQIPAHQHTFLTLSGTGQQQQGKPVANSHLARTLDQLNYSSSTTPNTNLGQIVGPTGGSQAHSNLQPYLAMNFCIALQGIYPPRS